MFFHDSNLKRYDRVPNCWEIFHSSCRYSLSASEETFRYFLDKDLPRVQGFDGHINHCIKNDDDSYTFICCYYYRFARISFDYKVKSLIDEGRISKLKFKDDDWLPVKFNEKKFKKECVIELHRHFFDFFGDKIKINEK